MCIIIPQLVKANQPAIAHNYYNSVTLVIFVTYGFCLLPKNVSYIFIYLGTEFIPTTQELQ